MQKYNLENDCRAIPFDRLKEALAFMPWASSLRVMFLMLALTGCRIHELDRMKKSLLYDNVLFWHLGKNQVGFRKERLPSWYLKELQEYWKNNRIFQDRFFGCSGDTFRRYFNRDVRPWMSRAWQEKRLVPKQGELQEEYILQLKGLRKTYQTLEFAKQLDKWKDSGVALEFTAKKMRHTTRQITAYHYIENFDALQIEKFKELTTEKIVQDNRQARLFEFS